MFFLTRRRVRPLPRAAFLGCGIPVDLLLLRRRRLAPAGHAHPSWALAGAGVRLRALAPHRQPAPVAKPPVGADLRETLDVLRALAAEVALDLARLDRLAKLHDLV